MWLLSRPRYRLAQLCFCGGILTTPFLLMYAFSAIQMTHTRWFTLNRTIVKTAVPVTALRRPTAERWLAC